MTIHHATMKKAEKNSIVLTEVDGEVEAWFPPTNKRVRHEEAKTALNLGLLYKRFGSEYRRVLLQPSEIEEGLWAVCTLDGEEVIHFDPNDDVDTVFADALEDAASKELSFEDERDYVVVPIRYKQLYKERGNPNHCGDWLSIWMDGRFAKLVNEGEGTKTVFDAVAFEMFLRENGVDMDGKWASLPTSGQKGWEGRYRMNGRQRLEKRMAHTGKLFHGGAEITIDPDFLNTIVAKHPVKKAKEA